MRASEPKDILIVSIVAVVLILGGMTWGEVVPLSASHPGHPPSARPSGLPRSPTSTIPLNGSSAAGWHLGNDENVSGVDVTYSERMNSMMTNGTVYPMLWRSMTISYSDGTDVSVGLTFHYTFNPGGADLSNGTVTNWSLLRGVATDIMSTSTVNGTGYLTTYTLGGFSIVNQSAPNVTFYNLSDGPGGWSYNAADVVSSFNYDLSLPNSTGSANGARFDGDIGPVTMKFLNYTYNGSTRQESLLDFNVTMTGQFSTYLESAPVPITLMFQVTHNITDTEYKYGANLNWSSLPAFPVSPGPMGKPSMVTGENYSLVMDDRFGLCYSGGNAESCVAQYADDPANETATYTVNGTLVGEQHFTTGYSLSGSTKVLNTVRTYYPVVGVQELPPGGVSNFTPGPFSGTFVVFGGFHYNESSGLYFDPSVTFPNSMMPSSQGPGAGVPLVVVVLVGVAIAGAVVAWRKKRKRSG